MDRIPTRKASYLSARRFCAWLLIALMLPGSLASSAVVWCVGSGGHSALEFCIGVDCDQSPLLYGATNAKTDATNTHRSQHGDCTDIAVVSVEANVYTRYFGNTEATFYSRGDGNDFPVLVRLLPPLSTDNHSRSSNLNSRSPSDFIDPNILSRRSTVLRI